MISTRWNTTSSNKNNNNIYNFSISSSKSSNTTAATVVNMIFITSILFSFVHVCTIATAFAAVPTTTTKMLQVHDHHQHPTISTMNRHRLYKQNRFFNNNNNNNHHTQFFRSIDSITSSTNRFTTTTSLSLLRGGGGGGQLTNVFATTSTTIVSYLSNIVQFGTDTPQQLFNTIFTSLLLSTIFIKIVQRIQQRQQLKGTIPIKKPEYVISLQRKFLSVFWLLRCSDWLQGPYFYEVYASKKLMLSTTNSIALISQLFLTGFASTALFGPLVGKAADEYGRKKATIAFTIIYAVGAISTKSSLLYILFAGRVLSGIGTSLLFSAPESWLVGEAQQKNVITTSTPIVSSTTATTTNNYKKSELVIQKEVDCTEYLGDTFGLAYAGDSIVAILAGQMAGAAATHRGPTGPFELSTIFLGIGGLLTTLLWKENKASTRSTGSTSSSNTDSDNATSSSSSSTSTKSTKKTTTREAIDICLKDPKIMLVGSVQSLFEAAMYIFVLQWPPAMSRAIQSYFASSSTTTAASAVVASTPYGTIFSCFMACCLLGSTLFGQLSNMKVPIEVSTTSFLAVATVAMSTSAWTVLQNSATATTATASLPLLVVSFFLFETVVGMYFPSIGTLRSRFVPDSHRSLIMNLFGIPLNVLVVSVFLSINKLGIGGALTISSIALGLATLCMIRLQQILNNQSRIITESNNNN